MHNYFITDIFFVYLFDQLFYSITTNAFYTMQNVDVELSTFIDEFLY